MSSIKNITGNEYLKQQSKRNNNNNNHEIYKNCQKCGFIYNLNDFSRLSNCSYCNRPLTLNPKKERELVEIEYEKSFIDETKSEMDNLKDLQIAMELKNRLVKNDLQSNTRNKVLDDQFDYYEEDNIWLSEQEQNDVDQKRKELKKKQIENRNTIKVRINFKTGKLLPADAINEDEELRFKSKNNSLTGQSKQVYQELFS